MTEQTQIGKYGITGDPIPGGMGQVYIGVDEALDRKVAIKVLHSHLTDRQGFRERFFREAKILAKLKHANITQVYEVGESDEGLFLTMEYVGGETLEDCIFQRRYRDLRQALPIIRQVCAALDYAHGQNVIHRDIKPSNIMVKPTGEAMLMDFGIAKHSDQPGMTQDGTTLGTPQYMSPEQCKGVPVDKRSDIYSFAVVVYEMLTGTRPIEGENVFSIINKQINNTPPPITLKNANLPRAVGAAMAKALSKDPARRHASAMEFYRDLAAADAAIEGKRRLKLSRRTILLCAAAVALIGLAAIGIVALTSRHEQGAGPGPGEPGPLRVQARPKVMMPPEVPVVSPSPAPAPSKQVEVTVCSETKLAAGPDCQKTEVNEFEAGKKPVVCMQCKPPTPVSKGPAKVRGTKGRRPGHRAGPRSKQPNSSLPEPDGNVSKPAKAFTGIAPPD